MERDTQPTQPKEGTEMQVTISQQFQHNVRSFGVTIEDHFIHLSQAQDHLSWGDLYSVVTCLIGEARLIRVDGDIRIACYDDHESYPINLPTINWKTGGNSVISQISESIEVIHSVCEQMLDRQKARTIITTIHLKDLK
jgi:hypothetical protein